MSMSAVPEKRKKKKLSDPPGNSSFLSSLPKWVSGGARSGVGNL